MQIAHLPVLLSKFKPVKECVMQPIFTGSHDIFSAGDQSTLPDIPGVIMRCEEIHVVQWILPQDNERDISTNYYKYPIGSHLRSVSEMLMGPASMDGSTAVGLSRLRFWKMASTSESCPNLGIGKTLLGRSSTVLSKL